MTSIFDALVNSVLQGVGKEIIHEAGETLKHQNHDGDSAQQPSKTSPHPQGPLTASNEDYQPEQGDRTPDSKRNSVGSVGSPTLKRNSWEGIYQLHHPQKFSPLETEEKSEFDPPSSSSHSSPEVPCKEDRILLPESISPSSPNFVLAKIPRVERVLLLYNPFSGNKKGEKLAKKAIKLFGKNGVEVVAKRSEKRGDIEEFARTANLNHVNVVITIGGDGTFHECINGWMKRDSQETQEIPLALIAGGTGNSFCRELYGNTKIENAVDHILRGYYCPMDLFRVCLPNSKGCSFEPTVYYSFNSVHWGLASRVNVLAEKMRWLGNAIRYTTASVIQVFQGERTRAKMLIENPDGSQIEYQDEFCFIIANNIISGAKGMKVAPRALINDGLIDLMIVRSAQKRHLMKIVTGMYDNGAHINLPWVEFRQVKSFCIKPILEGQRY